MSAAPVVSENSPGGPPSPERDALDRILRAQVLDRAPNLILFLRYICEMQTTGRTDSIKEYNIAVEALGRSADFDPKKDSIVRVEAHRLRKRLAEYYQTLGVDDPVVILLPPGSYSPTFKYRVAPTSSQESDSQKLESETAETIPVVNAELTTREKTGFGSRLYVYAGTGLVALGFVGVLVWPQRDAVSAPRRAVATTVRTSPTVGVVPGQAIRIASGDRSTALADRDGHLWRTDSFVSGGVVMTVSPRPIRRSADPSLYFTRREGDLTYRIPVAPGFYEVRLHFAETVFGDDNVAGGGESSRIFGVRVNDSEAWTADIISEAGGSNTATVRVYPGVRPGPDGTIRVSLWAERKESPFINGLEVLPAPDARMLPVRVVAQPVKVKTDSSEEWSSDEFWIGGLSVKRHERVDGPEASALYQGERYGNFSYAIPVAVNSTYTLTLRFAESWFGKDAPGGGGVGSRVFDVYCNGRTLLKNFDVSKEAGGPLRQVRKVFTGLHPTAQGKLNVQFVPVRNYAMVNAIEVTDEGSR